MAGEVEQRQIQEGVEDSCRSRSRRVRDSTAPPETLAETFRRQVGDSPLEGITLNDERGSDAFHWEAAESA